jgi:hypothetical protein
MKWKRCLEVGLLTLALAAPAFVITPTVGYAQTQSKENRDERQSGRQEARDTRQQGRQDSRFQKAECKAAGESRSSCRQQKRDTKQEARGEASEVKR